MTDSRAMTLKDLLHLVDRARRGTILPPELDDLHAGITALHAKAKAAETTVDRVAQWTRDDVVTAATSFGDGYRECQRDIRDLLPAVIKAADR